MDEQLSVPPELQHLIEKREREDRREIQRRTGTDRRKIDLGPLGAVESVENLESAVTEDQRSTNDRREQTERRQEARRKEDDE